MKNTNIKTEDAFLKSIDFSSNIINSIPGFVYLYEIIGDKMHLRKWNNFHTEVLGYSAHEMYNKDASAFFSKKEYKKIWLGVVEAVSKGSAQVEAVATSKDGTRFPCIFTGYVFNNSNSIYLIGVGTVISREKQIERELYKSRQEKKKKEEELARAKRELVSTALQISSTTEIVGDSLKAINNVLKKHSEKEYCEDLSNIKKGLETQLTKQDNWELFKLRFKEVHPFF